MHLYDKLLTARREHWKANNNVGPQRFELSKESFVFLNEVRRIVNETSNFKLRPGWENEFNGTPLVQTDGPDCMVAHDGTKVPL